MTVSKDEMAALRWMVVCNDESNIGYLWFLISKRGRGPVDEVRSLVDAGLATCRTDWIPREHGGYWITQAGRDALAADERVAA